MHAMEEVFSKKIIYTNTINNLETAINSFRHFAKTYEIPLVMVIKINKMLKELLSSILNYGFSKHQEAQIAITLELSGNGRLSIKITHKGIPFNPFHLTPPSLNIPVEEREIGGFGMHLVRKLMDEYSYQRNLDSNVIFLSKNQI